MPDPRAVQNLQMPHPGTDKAGKCPAVARGRAGRRWNWLMHDSWEKHEVNCPVRQGTFYNQRFEVNTYPFYLHHLVLAFRNCFIRKPPVHTISNGCASCAPRPSQKPRSDFSDMQISKTRELKITCMYNRRRYIQIRRSTSSTNSTIKFQIISTHCCLWNFDCFY